MDVGVNMIISYKTFNISLKGQFRTLFRQLKFHHIVPALYKVKSQRRALSHIILVIGIFSAGAVFMVDTRMDGFMK